MEGKYAVFGSVANGSFGLEEELGPLAGRYKKLLLVLEMVSVERFLLSSPGSQATASAEASRSAGAGISGEDGL